jgi:hypothetical protein
MPRVFFVIFLWKMTYGLSGVDGSTVQSTAGVNTASGLRATGELLSGFKEMWLPI